MTIISGPSASPTIQQMTVSFRRTDIAAGDNKHFRPLLKNAYHNLSAYRRSDTAMLPVAPASERIVSLGDYEIYEKIGSGAFGTVYLCRKKCSASLFAAKFIAASEELNQTSFEREVDNLKVLSHPFIVRLHGLVLPSPSDNRFVVLTEYVAGGSLQDAIANHPQWFDDTARAIIIYGIASGMSFIHSKNIIHRDLKARNVLLDEEHLPRICDFGSSRLVTEDTMSRTVQFTPFYAAPELFKKSPYSEKVDVYSFGVLVYEILTGKLAFRSFDPFQLMMHIIVNGKREPIPDSVTPFGKELIEKCWDSEPDNRPSFASISEQLTSNIRDLVHNFDASRFSNLKTKLGMADENLKAEPGHVTFIANVKVSHSDLERFFGQKTLCNPPHKPNIATIKIPAAVESIGKFCFYQC